MKILFLHGWNSKPGGVKPTYLARHGHEVFNPALPDDDFAAWGHACGDCERIRLTFEEKMAYVRTSQICRGKAAEGVPGQPAKQNLSLNDPYLNGVWRLP